MAEQSSVYYGKLFFIWKVKTKRNNDSTSYLIHMDMSFIPIGFAQRIFSVVFESFTSLTDL